MPWFLPRRTLLLLCLVLPSHLFAFDGPLWNKSQFPLFLPVDAPYLERAAPENSLALHLAYSNTFLLRTSDSWTVDTDMEIAELTLQYRVALTESWELGIDVPALSFSGGFLDGALNAFHNDNVFGINFDDYGRPSVPDDQFRYEVSRDGLSVIQGQEGSVGLGDARLKVKKVLSDGDPIVSLKAELEFPTGDAEKGFGSGSLDAGLGLLAEKQVRDTIKVYANLSAGFPGKFWGNQSVDLEAFACSGLAVEYMPRDDLSLVGQLTAQSSPWKTGILEVDDDGVIVASIGGRYRWDRKSFEVGFSEDLSKTGAPDFTLSFSFKIRQAGRRRRPPPRWDYR